MLGRLRHRVGFNGLMYGIVVIWALAAAGLIVGTLTNAFGIIRNAEHVGDELGAANRNLDDVGLSARTADLARRIARATSPLAGELREVSAVTLSISGSARSIGGEVGSINRGVAGIEAGARSIRGRAAAVNDATGTIVGRFSALVPVTRSIDRRVATISGQAGRVLALARPIRANLGATRGQTRAIHRHASQVNCAPVPVRDNGACDAHAGG